MKPSVSKLAFAFATLTAVVCGNGSADTTCAVIALGEGGARPTAAVGFLEFKLAGVAGIRLVDRGLIDRVLEEKALALISDKPELGDRREVGRLLSADLLVLLKAQAGEKAGLEASILDTHTGLRLHRETYPWSEGEGRSSVEEIIAALEKAIAKRSEEIVAVVAVPPFECADLSFEYERLGGAYARLVETALADRPGILLVELAEVMSLVKEVGLTRDEPTIKRPTPYYIAGKFRNHGRGESRRTDFDVELLQGCEAVAKLSQPDLTQRDIAPLLTAQLVSAFKVEIAGHTASGADPALELCSLNARATRFLDSGYWREALNLIEASLMVDPDQLEHHLNALKVYGKLGQAEYRAGVDWQGFLLRRLGHYRTALPHLEAVLRSNWLATGAPPGKSWEVFIAPLQLCAGSTPAGLAHPSTEIEKVSRELALERREICLRVFEEKAASATLTHREVEAIGRSIACDTDSLEDQRDTRLEMRFRLIRLAQSISDSRHSLEALAFDESGFQADPDPAYEAFLARIGELEGAEVRAALREIRSMQESARLSWKEIREWEADPQPTRETEPIVDPEVKFVRLDLKTIGPKGESRGSADRVFDWVKGPRGVDIVDVRGKLYLMRNAGQLEPFSPDKEVSYQLQVVFDGEYLWVPAIEGSELTITIFDASLARLARVTRTDGLPPAGRLVAATIAPGKICVAGSFGIEGRTRSWIALLSLNQDRSIAVDVILEAPRQCEFQSVEFSDPAGGDCAFTIGLLAALGTSVDPTPIKIFLRSGAGAIVIDPKSRSCERRKAPMRYEVPESQFLTHNGKLYWAEWFAGGSGIRCLGGDVVPRTVVRISERGFGGSLVFLEDRVLFADDINCWTAKNLESDFVKHSYGMPGSVSYRLVRESHHYGHVLLAGDPGIFRIRVTTGGG